MTAASTFRSRFASLRHALCITVAAASVVIASPLGLGASERPKVETEADLPQFSYPMTLSAQALLEADVGTFATLATQVKRDLETILRDYDIDDQGVLVRLMSNKVDLEMLFKEDARALKTCEQMRILVDREDFKATGMFSDLSFIRARMATGRSDGKAFQALYKKDFGSLVESLRWDIVADRVKKTQKKFERLSIDYVRMQVAADIESFVKEHQALDFRLATKLIFWRGTLLTEVPQRQLVLDILSAYIREHDPSAL